MTPGDFTIWSNDHVNKYLGNISLGIQGTGYDARDYELVVGIQWNELGWMIEVDAWVQSVMV